MAELAKLTRPNLHRVVPRERLFEYLDELRSRPLVWVSGPPGAGKTALAASFLAARRIGGVWYQIDAGDSDLATFFHYLGVSVADKGRRVAALPRFGPEHQGDLPGFSRLYFRALFARLKRPAVIVLDNYHELPREAALHGLLETIAREVPPGACVLVTSRTDPPPACAAMRATDRLGLLEWDALRLTLDETRRIAALRHALDEDTLRDVHAQADGWPVGLTLTLEQIARSGPVAATAHGEGREVLFDYFAGQIFDTLPQDERTILATTALLARASPAQAEALTGNPRAGTLLDDFYRRRLFVDRRGEYYQFHDLFRAFLLRQFERACPGADGQALRAKAVRLLQSGGQNEEAFALARHSRDWDAACALALDFAPHLFEQGRTALLRDWLDAVPEDRFDAIPWLGFWRAVAYSGTSPARARSEFAGVHARLRPGQDAQARVLCCAGLLMTHYLEFADFTRLDPWIDELLALLEQPPVLPAPAAELRVYTALLFALSYRRPDPGLLRRCIAHIQALLRTDCPLNARVDAAAHLLSYFVNCAACQDAADLVATVSRWLDDPSLSAFYRALWSIQLARFETNRGESDRGREVFREVLKLIDDNALTVPVLDVYCEIGLANLALLAGNPDEADAVRSRMVADATMDGGTRAFIAAHRGDRREAAALARQHVDLADRAGVQWHAFRSRIQLAYALIELGDDTQYGACLREARAIVTGTAYEAAAYQADLAEAYAAIVHGRPEAASDALARGLAGSRSDAGLFMLRLEPRALPRLLAHALATGIDAGYVRLIIRRFRLRAPQPDVPDWPWPLEIRTLGAFDVLRDGRPLEFSRKVPRKALAVLKALVALGGGALSTQRLTDVLWPDEDGDAAVKSLEATVHRLRAILGDTEAIIAQGGRISLDPDRVWVDVFAFEAALTAADRAIRARDASAIPHWQRALDLYRGAFLADDETEPWTVAVRERLRGRYIHALVAFGQALEQSGDFEAAIAANQRGLAADPVIESFYQGLMRCYARLDRHAEAIGAYRRLKQILSVTLGMAPGAETERLYRSLRQ
ncbi:MAG: BTAD domain-containing putative transcriptional regulator [Gammaproteobacteria bacterium]